MIEISIVNLNFESIIIVLLDARKVWGSFFNKILNYIDKSIIHYTNEENVLKSYKTKFKQLYIILGINNNIID